MLSDFSFAIILMIVITRIERRHKSWRHMEYSDLKNEMNKTSNTVTSRVLITFQLYKSYCVFNNIRLGSSENSFLRDLHSH